MTRFNRRVASAVIGSIVAVAAMATTAHALTPPPLPDTFEDVFWVTREAQGTLMENRFARGLVGTPRFIDVYHHGDGSHTFGKDNPDGAVVIKTNGRSTFEGHLTLEVRDAFGSRVGTPFSVPVSEAPSETVAPIDAASLASGEYVIFRTGGDLHLDPDDVDDATKEITDSLDKVVAATQFRGPTPGSWTRGVITQPLAA